MYGRPIETLVVITRRSIRASCHNRVRRRVLSIVAQGVALEDDCLLTPQLPEREHLELAESVEVVEQVVEPLGERCRLIGIARALV